MPKDLHHDPRGDASRGQQRRAAKPRVVQAALRSPASAATCGVKDRYTLRGSTGRPLGLAKT
ncbi:hypothetical protein GCM10010508_41450 [Streptomyces naganishii JCM 4654]|uniref:Uncharacterized protein n=1 Tax=Streptomyces naganishii JCM 4654 TaxID=1306179 RepID=A0A918Y6J8_9ACTN|nr:hypothetical protein GCM10010508_41450 [Streptomyces naganishii JCM 4654]